MARVKLVVDKKALQKEIKKAEATGKYTNVSQICDAVAESEWAKGHKRPLTSAVIRLRIQEFGIELAVGKGKRGRAKIEIERDKLESVIQEVESKQTFSKQGDLWEAVANTTWAKTAFDRPLSATVIYLRVQEFGIEVQTPPARRGKGRKRVLENSDQDDSTADAPQVQLPPNRILNEANSGVVRNPSLVFVTCPAGDCPHKLTKTDFDSVEDWCMKVVKTMAEKGQQIAPSGLAYYAREFFDIFSEDHEQVKEHIQTCKFDIY